MDDLEIPTMGSVTGAAGDYVYGLVGGVAYSVLGDVTARFTGSQLIGSAVAGIGAGAIIEGERGEIIATMAGFQSAFLPEVQGPVDSVFGAIF